MAYGPGLPLLRTGSGESLRSKHGGLYRKCLVSNAAAAVAAAWEEEAVVAAAAADVADGVEFHVRVLFPVLAVELYLLLVDVEALHVGVLAVFEPCVVEWSNGADNHEPMVLVGEHLTPGSSLQTARELLVDDQEH